MHFVPLDSFLGCINYSPVVFRANATGVSHLDYDLPLSLYLFLYVAIYLYIYSRDGAELRMISHQHDFSFESAEFKNIASVLSQFYKFYLIYH